MFTHRFRLWPLALLPACGAPAPDIGALHAEAEAVLDDFHLAASEADAQRYFNHYRQDAVFLGTDASERWSVDALRAYAKPHFDAGKGWSYQATERHVRVSEEGRIAWFDERLAHARYGEVRGSGVLIRDEVWKVAQYNLSFPVPNDIAEDVIAMIQGAKADGT